MLCGGEQRCGPDHKADVFESQRIPTLLMTGIRGGVMGIESFEEDASCINPVRKARRP